MKKGKIILGCFLFLIIGMVTLLYCGKIKAERRQKGIAKEIVRLHVIANSDSDNDQKLKMRVKESVVMYLRETMGKAVTVEEAKEQIKEKLPQIEQIAKQKMQSEGYFYEVKAELGNCYFPVKQYGDLTFPAGQYEALRIEIGKSKGRNWWCVMYPSLCFVDSVYQIVPDESKEKLRTSLTAEEYDSLLDGGDEVHYSSKIIEWVEGILSY